MLGYLTLTYRGGLPLGQTDKPYQPVIAITAVGDGPVNEYAQGTDPYEAMVWVRFQYGAIARFTNVAGFSITAERPDGA
jgi:hypothetical protein